MVELKTALRILHGNRNHKRRIQLSARSKKSILHLIKMKNFRSVEIFIMFIVTYYITGSTIVCYECNSAINSMCSATLLPDSLKRNCSDHERGVTHTLCRKIIQHVDHEVNGQMPVSRVIRSCGWDETKYKGACYHRSGYGGRQEVCSCTKDLCNSSHDLNTSSFFTITLVIIFNFIYKCVI